MLFSKELDNQTVYVALNLDDQPCDLQFGTHYGALADVIGGGSIHIDNGTAYLHLEP